MTFSDKVRYDRLFHKFTHKVGGSEMNYINIFQNAQALSVLMRNSYSENQFRHIFLNHFHQGRKYIAHIASHQAELREKNITDQKSLSITYLQTGYLGIDISSGSRRNNEGKHFVLTKCTFCGGNNHSAEKYFKKIRNYKGKSCADGNSNRQRTELKSRKFLDVDM